ncbi:MAG: hypothetical protein M3O31_10565 [Acidobacteriota bacterium]|nr:hypothetical protein [Acidobacteriota bacterium]
MKEDIGHTEQCSKLRASVRLQFCRRQVTPTERGRQYQHGKECGQNAADTSLIKIEEGKCPSAKLAENDGADQVARDNKKYVDPDKAALKACPQMKEDNKKDGHPPKARNIGAILQSSWRHAEFYMFAPDVWLRFIR